MAFVLEQKARIDVYGKEIPRELILRKEVVKPVGYSLWRIYEINIICKEPPNPERVKDLVNRLEEDVKGLKVIWIGIEDNVIKVQVTGNFALPTLWEVLPNILIALAILFIAIILLLLVLKIPGEWLAVIIVALGLPFSIILAKYIYEEMRRK